MENKKRTSAFAPASVGNVGVGFDTLGHALNCAGDTVTIRAGDAGAGVTLGHVTGILQELPADPSSNTALLPLIAIRDERSIDDGIIVDIDKGIPLGSGMGGSAASAVAAVVAADTYWDLELSKDELLAYSLMGEAVASGSPHADNAAPSLYGGLVLCEGTADPIVTSLTAPPTLCCVLVHPAVTIETREGRGLLRKDVPLEVHVRQSQYLAGFVAGCLRNDLDQITRCLRDIVIEPQRSKLIPGFENAQRAALEAGALGCSISGSGPSVFAWCTKKRAETVRGALVEAFEAAGLQCDGWISLIDAPGARVMSSD